MGNICFGGSISEVALTPAQRDELQVFREVCDKMDQIEREEYRKNSPSQMRLILYYFQNIGMLIETPIHLAYHLTLSILLRIMLIPMLVVRCCMCHSCCLVEELPQEKKAQNTDTQTESPVAEAAVAEVTSNNDSGTVAREYVEPGFYNFLVRQLAHNDYVLSAYATMFKVIFWNLFRPDRLVAFISDEYFVPFLRPVVPKFQPRVRNQDDCPCCDDFEPDMRFRSLRRDLDCDTVGLILLLSPLIILSEIAECCDGGCCQHEMVRFLTYKDMYLARSWESKEKTDEEFLAEFYRDRKSPVGIARRHPEKFVRGLYFSLSGFRSFHGAKICGPCCGCCRDYYKDFREFGQEWQNDIESESVKRTTEFFKVHFEAESYHSLLKSRTGTGFVGVSSIPNPTEFLNAKKTAAKEAVTKKAKSIYSKFRPFRGKDTAPSPESMKRAAEEEV